MLYDINVVLVSLVNVLLVYYIFLVWESSDFVISCKYCNCSVRCTSV